MNNMSAHLPLIIKPRRTLDRKRVKMKKKNGSDRNGNIPEKGKLCHWSLVTFNLG